MEIMKRCGILLVVLLMLTVTLAASAEVNQQDSYGFTEARANADQLEEQYGIKILLGDECLGTEASDTYLIGSSSLGKSPLRNILGTRWYPDDVAALAAALEMYPQGFFSKFRTAEAPEGLRILLANQIIETESGSEYGGLTVMGETTYDVNLSINRVTKASVHHELWHAVELCLTYTEPDAFDAWGNINPEGFTYTGSFDANGRWNYQESLAEQPDSYFMNGYSLVSEHEDRATVAEKAFSEDEAWWIARPHLYEKLMFMADRASDVFGTIYPVTDGKEHQ